ncbi:MFS general substrate transporter [Mollisia scopiformis]|uniref:Efflux pump dotC n=1 Tax=Mollisia scopiformis TaxID=149040 RepID=A0A194XX54_MOLSC|nr:MFS general substrate transporter [Mollisia scopiformis]KUJ24664.1 MFS general substrate transporter [Mollisia scopiformis]
MDTEKQLEAERQAAAAGPGADGGTTTIEGQTAEHHTQNLESSSLSSKNVPNGSLDTSIEESAIPPPTSTETKNGAPASTNPEDSRTKFQTTVIMISLCMSTFLAALDITIITTALPTISEHFHSNAGYTWIGSAYLLANAASTPSWGKFSDIWGRKPIILVAQGVFFVGSLIAALSVNIGMLIVARAIQGIGGGGLIILTNICIGDLFSMRNRGAYYGIIGMVWAFASGVGPILGGVFTEKVSWRWCFYINLPCTGSVFLVLVFFLHLHNPRTPVWEGLKAVDWAGSLTIVGGTLMLLLGLEFGGVTYPWASAKVICLIIFGIVVAGLFVLNEWKFARYPVMPLRLFKQSSNIASLGVCFCHGFVFIAGTYYLPLYFQAVLGATPLLSGVYLLPFVMALSFTSGITGVFIKKTGKYLPPIYFGLTIMTLGNGLFINLPLTEGWAKIIIYQIVAGIGVGPLFQSPLIALQSLIPPKDIATATATFGFTRNISTAISVVIGSVVFQNEMQKRHSSLVASLGPTLANQLGGGNAGASVGIVTALPPAQREIARRAFWESLRIMWILYVAFAALGLFISLFIKSNKLSKEHQTVKTGLAEEERARKERAELKKAGKEQVRADKEAEKAGNLVDNGDVAGAKV